MFSRSTAIGLDWQRDFRSRLDRKFRTIFQVPDDHIVEDKLARRCQPEELELSTILQKFKRQSNPFEPPIY